MLDAAQAYDLRSPDGQHVPAEQIRQLTATTLHEEFATIVTTAEMIATILSHE